MIRTNHSHLDVAARTHPGKSGKQNEDRFAVSAYRVQEGSSIASVFAIVADGIGGHHAGELAAETAVNTISHVVAQSDASTLLHTLQLAIQSASQAIASQAQDDTQHLGMGTTCACAWIIGQRLYTASVGDSRIYLMRGTTIQQLTTDHTWIQEAIDEGILSAEQARENANIHVIRRYLGSRKPPEVDLRMRVRGNESDTQAKANQGFVLLPNDRVLLCTDGLTDEASEKEILEVSTRRTLKHAAQALVDLANSHGGHDNITVILLQVPDKSQRKYEVPWLLIATAVGGLLLLCALAICLIWILLHL